MREILFRGKAKANDCCKDGGYWVYGDIGHTKHYCDTIVTNEWDTVEVDPETVGQFTGMCDKNGTRIFEGDVMVFCKGATHPFEIKWDGLGWKMFRADGTRIKDPFESWEIWHMQRSEVIGNRWDNPELLEDENND